MALGHSHPNPVRDEPWLVVTSEAQLCPAILLLQVLDPACWESPQLVESSSAWLQALDTVHVPSCPPHPDCIDLYRSPHACAFLFDSSEAGHVPGVLSRTFLECPNVLNLEGKDRNSNWQEKVLVYRATMLMEQCAGAESFLRATVDFSQHRSS